MTSPELITITKQEYEAILLFKTEKTEAKTEIEYYKSEVEILKHQLAELKRIIFGTKSERYIAPDPAQLTLFEVPADENQECEQEEITYKRKKNQNKKQPLRMEIPAHLPRKTEVIEPENLPDGAKQIGVAVTEVLEYEPASIFVRRIERPKYITEQNDEATNIVIADLPSLPIPKGNAGEGLLAHILISKFVDHLPYYRQVQMFKRQNVNIPESTIGGWFNASCKLLEPLYEALKQMILSGDYLQADETPISVLTKDKPGATHKGYHWVYFDPVRRLVLFDYQKSRGREGPDEFLKNFSGRLQTDGYTAYNNLKNQKDIILLACMSHARRKFEHALDNHHVLASQAMEMFGILYDIERDARNENLSFDEIKELRRIKAKPVLEKMELWLKEQINLVLPQSAIGKAIAYTLRLWPRLIRYIENGKFCIDNNLIENSIRPIALGRKNYLFAGSHDAAQQAAIVYSLLATCKIKNVEPYTWLKKTLSVLPDYPANRLHELLPA